MISNRYLFDKIFSFASDDLKNKIFQLRQPSETEVGYVSLRGSEIKLIDLSYPKRSKPLQTSIIGSSTQNNFNFSTYTNRSYVLIGSSLNIPTDYTNIHLSGQNSSIQSTNAYNLNLTGGKIEIKQHQYSRIEYLNVIGSNIKITIEPFALVKNINIIGNNLQIIFTDKHVHQNQNIIDNNQHLVF